MGNTAAPAAGILSSQTGYIAKVSVFYGEILLSFRGRIGCVTEQDRNGQNSNIRQRAKFFYSHLARYSEACFGFAGQGTASPWSEAFPEVLYLLFHRL